MDHPREKNTNNSNNVFHMLLWLCSCVHISIHVSICLLMCPYVYSCVHMSIHVSICLYMLLHKKWSQLCDSHFYFDHEILQTDLSQLHTWSDKWQMEFNVSKCVHLPITKKTKPSPHKYSLSGQPLFTVSSHSYLGVKLDSKLTWTNHVTDITSKSFKFLGVIKRTFGPCKPEVKQTAYNMLIWPKLKYSSPIWNLQTFSQVKSLERVQYSAARFVKNDYRQNTNPADLITALGWPTLERRRIIKQATTFYKILNNIIEITPPPGLLTHSRIHGQYVAPKCRINAMVFSFYPQAIRIWNVIPPKITNIKNPKSFQEAIMELPFTTPPHLNCF